MNIIFPSAGEGSRFTSAGYVNPKPLINVGGKSIIERAISSLGAKGNYYVVTSCLPDGQVNRIKDVLKKNKLSGDVINLSHKTTGAPETCLAVESFINSNEPLIICNNDHETSWNFNLFESFVKENDYDAVVTTYSFSNIKIGEKSPYSHVRVDKNRLALEFAEKTAISDLTLNGIFYWKEAKTFFDSARLLIKNPFFVNGEKYVSQTLNYLVDSELRVSYYPMEESEYVSLGTPEDVNKNISKLK